MQTQLGQFILDCEPDGKLAGLAVAGVAPFLSDATHRQAMGGGRVFAPRGWDECFPSIEPFGGCPVLGDLIWTPPAVRRADAALVQEWTLPRYEAARRFAAEEPRRLAVGFSARNTGPAPFRFLWASHALFSFRGLDRVVFADGAALAEFGLDGSSSKTFRLNAGPVRLVRADCEIELESDQPWWGVWCNRGGWPAADPAGVGVLGIEATTVDADLPGEASLPPGGEFHGAVRLTVRT